MKNLNSAYSIMSEFLCAFFLCIVVSFHPVNVIGQTIPFEKIHGSTYFNEGMDAHATPYDEYVIFGNTQQGIGANDYCMIKTNEYGDTIWTHNYGTNNEDHLVAGLVMNTGYILCGWTDGGTAKATFIIKTDTAGTIIWSYKYGNSNRPESIRATSDGGYIVCGQSDSIGLAPSLLLLKLTGTGQISWKQEIDVPGYDSCFGIAATENYFGGYVVAGSVRSNGNPDILLMQLASTGTLTWIKVHGNNVDFEIPFDILSNSYGTYLLCQHFESSPSFLLRGILLWKINSLGSVSWGRDYYDNFYYKNYFPAAFTDSNYGDIIITGTTFQGANNYGGFVIRVDDTGQFLYGEQFEPGTTFRSVSRATGNGAYVVNGTIEDIHAPNDTSIFTVVTGIVGPGCNSIDTTWNVGFYWSSYVIPTPNIDTSVSIGLTLVTAIISRGSWPIDACTVGVDEVDRNQTIHVFPNPFSQNVTLVIPESLLIHAREIQIIDCFGRTVFSAEITSQVVDIRLENIPSGIYTYIILGDVEVLLTGNLIAE